MKFSTVILLLAPLVQNIFSVPEKPGCANRVIRKEWRELSAGEKDRFFAGVNALKKTPGAGSLSKYEEFTKAHLDAANYAHNQPLFLVWHRKFLRDFEIAMQQVLKDNTFALPYWQWSLDSQAPGNFFKAFFTD